jgi:uncharacterized protein (DUF4415 family)
MSNSSQTDWDALRQMSDSEIDYSDIPPLDDTLLNRAELRIPAADAQCLVRLEPEIVAWFQAHGSQQYQALINAALREHMATH